MDSDFQSDCFSLSISGTQLKDTSFKKRVLYKLQGSDSKGDYQIHRRYKDFATLRELLQLNWPGCFIPMLPPKKMIVIFT
jgi:hypothetical protein